MFLNVVDYSRVLYKDDDFLDDLLDGIEGGIYNLSQRFVREYNAENFMLIVNENSSVNNN